MRRRRRRRRRPTDALLLNGSIVTSITGAVTTAREDRLGVVLGEDIPVWVLAAPAGFGKTTAIEALLDRGHGRRVLRIAFGDEGAGRASVGRILLAERLRSGAQHLETAVSVPGPLVGDLGDDGWAIWAERSAASFASVGGSTLLVFDDLQVLTPAAAEVLGHFVRHVASIQHRVIVGTRERLPWPVDQWQMRGFAARLSAEELAYEPHEVEALLSTLDTDLVREATDLFRGWPFPVQLLASRCARGGSAQTISEVIHDATDHLSGAVLDGLDPSHVRVVCRVAILDDFPAAVAEEVSGSDRAAQILEELARHRFLVEVDGNRFDFHPLVRSILLRRCCNADARMVRELHGLAAAAWMDQRGEELRALRHLVDARAWTTAFQLVIDHWNEALTSQRFDLIMATIDACPRRTWANEGTIALFAAATHLVSGDPIKAAVYLRAPAIKAHPAGPVAAKLLVGHATWWATNPAAALELTSDVTRLLEELPADVTFPSFPGMDSIGAYRIMNDFARARALALLGEFAEARRSFMVLLGRPGGLRPVPEISALGTVAWIDAMTGDLGGARRLAAGALAAADAYGVSRDHERLAPATLALAMCANFDRQESSWTHIDVVARAARENGASGLARTCELVAADCGDPFFAADDPDRPKLKPYAMPMADQFVTTLRARDLLRNGQMAEATDLLAGTTPNELVLSAWAEVRLANADANAVRRSVDAMPPPSTARGRVERLLAEAIVHPDATVSESLSRSAMGLAQRTGLQRLLDRAPRRLWPGLVSSAVVDPTQAVAIDGADRVAPGGAPLTAREFEILRLLDSPLVARQIADRLFVSEHTVKWHLARIYRKLGVSGRVEAVSQARAVGLIEVDEVADGTAG